MDKDPKGAGRKPQNFMHLLKSFICARYMDMEVNSGTICSLLNSNPAFLERMGYKGNIPTSYRVIDRFDQVLSSIRCPLTTKKARDFWLSELPLNVISHGSKRD